MLTLYNLFVIPLLRVVASVAAKWNPKFKLAVEGRARLQQEVVDHYAIVAPSRKRFLIHVSSFGELEQAKPVIARLKESDPQAHIHLTFFSPSGYQNAIGKYDLPDIITYAPFDSLTDVRAFLDVVRPNVGLFVRYDLWPNIAHELHERRIPSVLFSATFDPKRANIFVRSFHRSTYNQLTKILTISEFDKKQFENFGVAVPEIIQVGDTRFDQVITRKASIEMKSSDYLSKAITDTWREHGMFVLVAGSTWPGDETLLADYIEGAHERKESFVSIIAPHEPTHEHILKLKQTFGSNGILLSECANYNDEKVVIVDSVGKLFSLYQYATVAYVGGGFEAGVHNVLEPAAWGKPVVVGPKNERSQEVKNLIDAGGGFEATGVGEFSKVITKLYSDTSYTLKAGEIAASFIENQSGATDRIMREVTAL